MATFIHGTPPTTEEVEAILGAADLAIAVLTPEK